VAITVNIVIAGSLSFYDRVMDIDNASSPVSIQTQSLALRAETKTARNASACVDKQPIMVATASTEHSYWLWRLRLLREISTQQTQAPANRNARLKQWQP